MRVLIVTNLFPNAEDPRIASFNRQQFSALGKRCEVEVMAPLPWYPAQKWLGRFATHKVASSPPKHEIIDDLPVSHPRTLHLPKIGKPIAAPLFAASLLPKVLPYRGKVDVVLGSWAHPDGCAAVLLSKVLGVPSAVKLHGSDINVGANLPGPRRAMRAILPHAGAIISVSSALSEEVAKLGVLRDKIHLVMNGVDCKLFYPRSQAQARRELALPEKGKIGLFVGNLIEAKGVFDLKTAVAKLPEASDLNVYMVGRGQEESLKKDAPHRFHVVGSQPFEKIPLWMAACDFLVLPSWNEGTPNVVLEALTCGRRVIATDVGGIPDLLSHEKLGQMVPIKAPERLAQALQREEELSAVAQVSAEEIASLGGRGDWDESAAQLEKILRNLL